MAALFVLVLRNGIQLNMLFRHTIHVYVLYVGFHSWKNSVVNLRYSYLFVFFCLSLLSVYWFASVIWTWEKCHKNSRIDLLTIVVMFCVVLPFYIVYKQMSRWTIIYLQSKSGSLLLVLTCTYVSRYNTNK